MKEVFKQYNLQKDKNVQGTFMLSSEEMIVIEAILKLIEEENKYNKQYIFELNEM